MENGNGASARLPLPPLAGVKRPAPAWDVLAAAPGLLGPAAPRHKLPLDESAQFAAAAMAGARAQRDVDNARGTGVFETYELGIAIVRSSKLYANQRRSNRQLPGGSDSTTAACYMLGGTPDSTLSPLVARVSPCDPREERCKAVERVLKDKTRGAICSLNGENPREARADNLAAVRICEVVADILVAYAAKRLLNSLQDLYKSNAAKDDKIRDLQEQLDGAKRRRVDGACWCGGREQNAVRFPTLSPNGGRPAPAPEPFYGNGKEVPLAHALGARTLPPPAGLSSALPAPGLLPVTSSTALLRGSSPLPAHSGGLGFGAAYSSAIDGAHWAPVRHNGTG